jgi:hypothetical protein
LLIPSAATFVQTQETGNHRRSLLVGMVIDPAVFGVEQVHGVAAIVFSYRIHLGNQNLLAIFLRPTILYNSRSIYFRLPLYLELLLIRRKQEVRLKNRSAALALLAGAGLGTWDSEPNREVKPLFPGGAELSVYPFSVSGLARFVMEQGNVDSLVDLFLGYYCEM